MDSGSVSILIRAWRTSASPSRVTVGVSSATEVSSKPVAGVPVTIALIGKVRLVSWLPTRIVTWTLDG